jgi:hypothetical protein
VVGLAEAKPVEQRDRPGSHRDDVAEDAADPGRGALEGLDGRRVVVAFDLERDRLAFAEVDDAGVLAGPLEDAGRRGREALQKERRVLVGAVLRPEQREDREIEMIRLAAEQIADSVELLVREAERAVERLFCDPRQESESICASGWATVPGTMTTSGAGPSKRRTSASVLLVAESATHCPRVPGPWPGTIG